MGKEIERKWLINPEYDLESILTKPSIIRDYYFNPYTRLRLKDGKTFITIKSLGTLERDEFEFEIDKSQINFLPVPNLAKTRYKVLHDGHEFEINVFKDIGFREAGKHLILVELELTNKDEIVNIPEWCGEEVTEDPKFYGYNLYLVVKQMYIESKNKV